MVRLIWSLGLVVGLAGCGGQDDVSLVALVGEDEPGLLDFATTCGRDVSVRVNETSDEVRITAVQGMSIDGDCLGAVNVQLQAPLGARDIVVDGERWVELAATCPLGTVGPADGRVSSEC